MIPIVTPDEMAAVDAAAPDPVEVLIERAGSALAWQIRRLLGGLYGRRIVVVAGPGNNGADGRVAAGRLSRWGAHVLTVDARDAPATLPDSDLVVDAAFGTGLSRPYTPPTTQAPVLAVDIVSGVSGLTGEPIGSPSHAAATVTFQALKPGLLFGAGADLTGAIRVVDIGLDVSATRAHLVEAADVAAWLPQRPTDSHKWKAACWIIAGSESMTGAASLAASAAARAGSGYVRLSVPGVRGVGPTEVVAHPLPETGWGASLDGIERFGSLVIGPGLGRSAASEAGVHAVLGSCPIPTVIDGDGLERARRASRPARWLRHAAGAHSPRRRVRAPHGPTAGTGPHRRRPCARGVGRRRRAVEGSGHRRRPSRRRRLGVDERRRPPRHRRLRRRVVGHHRRPARPRPRPLPGCRPPERGCTGVPRNPPCAMAWLPPTC